jgi:Tfp pilus assembly protein PilW
MTEMLISTAIGGVILLSVFDLYVQTAKSTMNQSDMVELQTQMRAAMDMMAKDLRLMYGTPIISTTTDTDDTISFQRTRDSGYSSGGNATNTISDSIKSWSTNKYAPTATESYTLFIVSGAGVGEAHQIAGNTASTLTLADSWTTVPDTTSLYLIYQDITFSRTADNKLTYKRGTGEAHQIASGVTSLAFSQPNPTSVTVTMQGRTEHPDKFTGQYAYFSMTGTFRKRN